MAHGHGHRNFQSGGPPHGLASLKVVVSAQLQWVDLHCILCIMVFMLEPNCYNKISSFISSHTHDYHMVLAAY